MSIPYFDAAAIHAALPYERAIRAIEEAVRDDIDPELDGPRLFAPAPGGEFLLMPAQGARYCGLKALTIAPKNPERGLEKIQGVYVLYSADTLAPIALMEGSSLTAIRTPAVALAALRLLAKIAPQGAELPAAPRVLIFGVGTQGRGCVAATRAVFPTATFELVGRRPERVQQLVRELHATGIEARVCEDPGAAVATADIIICATTASSPLFDGSLVKPGALVAAIGTHGHAARELDDTLIARADLIVEGRGSAERENGNLHTYFDEERWRTSPPASLRDLVRGTVTRHAERPAVYTGVGMSWEDLVCATVVFEEGTPSQ